VREFSAEYLREARAGMWSDDRGALADLDLPGRERVLDVGCGSGEFTRVLREESDAELVGVDADPGLLARTDAADALVAGDATRLPFREDAADLVACQALLVNLPDPGLAVREFARVSSDLVAVVEPDNAAVSVDSTVGAESALAARARQAYVAGMPTDVTLGADAADLFEECGLTEVTTRPYHHAKRVESPYSEAALEGARRKLSASRLADARDTLLAGDLDADEYDALVADWKAMGRAVVEQMQDDAYRRAEVVPYHVTVGRV
jgi:SAM-dependent methyltransferase